MSRKQMPAAGFSRLLRILVFIAKVKKLSFEKYYASLVRKTKQRNRKQLRLTEEHYSYVTHNEFEFSPSSSPLIRYPRKQFKKNRVSARHVETLFFLLCKCWGSFGHPEGEEYGGDFSSVEAIPVINEDVNALALAFVEPSTVDWESDEASIDMRAQMFIERFYEDMRMQRQESTTRACLMN